MASYRGIWRTCLWRCVCVCLLLATVSAEAATRIPVKVPSGSVVAKGAGAASRSGENIRIPGEPGVEYIPRTPSGTPGTPVKVIPTLDYSIPRTITQTKNLLKANVGNLLLSGTIAALVAGVDWIETDGMLMKKKYEPIPYDPQYTYWSLNFNANSKGATQAQACANAGLTAFKINQSGNSYTCTLYYPTPTAEWGTYNLNKIESGGCPSGAVWRDDLQACGKSQLVPLTDADLTAIDPYVNAASPEWIRSLMKDSCSGSPSPNACLDSLVAQSRLSGPAKVDGGTQTSTTTYTKPDGTTGTRSSEAKTSYSIVYGDNYFDYSKSVVTTNYEDGEKTGETTETENPDVTQEEPEEDEDKPTADPCADNCDGPKYEDLYKPTEDTKEKAIDSYASRVKNIPIINAATGFFNVSVSASCPVWQTSVDMDVYGRQFHSDLKFDQHCQPWFTDYRPFAIAVVLIIAALGAFWVATLD